MKNTESSVTDEFMEKTSICQPVQGGSFEKKQGLTLHIATLAHYSLISIFVRKITGAATIGKQE
jgi:hypothetical protein